MLESLKNLREKYNDTDIKNEVICKLLEENKVTLSKIKNKNIQKILKNRNKQLKKELHNTKINTFKTAEKIFENMIPEDDKKANGIVFTPEYIADFIIQNTITKYNKDITIIDPACRVWSILTKSNKIYTRKTEKANHKHNRRQYIRNRFKPKQHRITKNPINNICNM